MPKTLYMFKGLPASGKSTKAREILKDIGYGNAKIINKDQLRAMLDDGHWSGANEAFILSVRDNICHYTLANNRHVIVDDTNLHPKHEVALCAIVKTHSANFEIYDLTNIDVEECISRDKKRANYVGEKVIRDMWERYIRPKIEPPPHNPKLPDCVICDIDGTVAQMQDRGPYEWDKVYFDWPRRHVLRALESFTNNSVLFVSGRDECCREATAKWLSRYMPVGSVLFMRPQGDMRKDAIVKREIYETHIKDKYNVVAIFDDRPQVIRLWQELGFSDRIFNVGDGREF